MIHCIVAGVSPRQSEPFQAIYLYEFVSRRYGDVVQFKNVSEHDAARVSYASTCNSQTTLSIYVACSRVAVSGGSALRFEKKFRC